MACAVYAIALREDYDAFTIMTVMCGLPNKGFVVPSPNPPVPGSSEDEKLNRNNRCRVNQIASPGTLSYVEGHDALLIGTLVINIAIATKNG